MNTAQDYLSQINALAGSARFAEMLVLSRALLQSADSLALLLDLGSLLHAYGFLSDARQCFERARTLAPNDLRPLVNLANVCRDGGEHGRTRLIYSELARLLPDHSVIRRNALTSMEYDPDVPDTERLAHAKAWGEWAVARAGGPRPRPELTPLTNRRLRVGYVSADFCQHTVGLFVKDVLKNHDASRLEVYAYSAGQVRDWVTEELRVSCHFRDVSALDDTELAAQIRSDGIDVLIDLSGHTAGSRLTAFAHRPAPVMASWLGYFASTGLSCIDAVLMDTWHVPAGCRDQFVEQLIDLPGGRFCYQPVPWAPAQVSPLPAARNGCITFGCFNNTAKLNHAVIDVWAQILCHVNNSRLVLKWRTFNDDALKETITRAFVDRGVAADRIELRGPSFHADLLNQYADIDIALDPFPFTGGLTSCEALWMGVPVITWPQSRAVSRQTWAILNQIGLPELAADSAAEYQRLAIELSCNTARLAHLRRSLRDRMRESSLMDCRGFTQQMETTLLELFNRHLDAGSGKLSTNTDSPTVLR